MSNLTWEEFKAEWMDDHDPEGWDYYVYKFHEGGKLPCWLYTLIEKIRFPFRMAWQFVLMKRCEREGHHLVDDGSWANPESGGDAYRCTRCGESWRHVYY